MSGAADTGWLLKGVLVVLVLAALLVPTWLIARRGAYSRRAWLQAATFFGVANFAVLAAAVAVDLNIPGDYAASAFFQELHLAGQTHRVELFTMLGGWYLVLPLTVLAALVVAVWSPRAALYLVTAVVVSTVVNVAMKGLFQRVPPHSDGADSILLAAFPSGHAMRTMTLALALAVVLPARRWRWPLAIAAVGLAALVGLSRIYLQDHFFSDVVGAWALALAVACGLALVWPGLAPARPASAGIRAVLFDWGNTLMIDDGRAGPMAEWREVAAVPGAADTLAALDGDYVIAVATNADDSGADLVTAALGRVGLARHVTRVFSSRDIGARKPDPAFYAAVLRDLDGLVANGADPLRPDQVVMVGDSYANDIAGAKAAGLLTSGSTKRAAKASARTRPTTTR